MGGLSGESLRNGRQIGTLDWRPENPHRLVALERFWGAKNPIEDSLRLGSPIVLGGNPQRLGSPIEDSWAPTLGAKMGLSDSGIWRQIGRHGRTLGRTLRAKLAKRREQYKSNSGPVPDTPGKPFVRAMIPIPFVILWRNWAFVHSGPF